MEDLEKLASLLTEMNAVGSKIAEIIGRPAEKGHVGEYIAGRIFGISPAASAAAKGIDGYFADGALAGRSVNVKWFTKRDGNIDIPTAACDHLLILTGPKGPAATSRGTTRAWVIEAVYLFDVAELVRGLRERGRTAGTATSVGQHLWDAAEIYPVRRNRDLDLTDQQRKLLALFGAAPPTHDPH